MNDGMIGTERVCSQFDYLLYEEGRGVICGAKTSRSVRVAAKTDRSIARRKSRPVARPYRWDGEQWQLIED